MGAVGDGASIGALVSSAQMPKGHAWYAVTWLLKYGRLTQA